MKSPHRESAFTLLELVVVIAVIALLVALLGVFMAKVIVHASNERARVLVLTLDRASMAYSQAERAFPPDDRGDSRNLHFYLGRSRLVSVSVDQEPPLKVVRPPYVDFKAEWLELSKGQVPNPLQPVPVIDPWDHPIQYRLPGTYCKPGPDIWSRGANGVDDLVGPGGQTDDISNWVKD